MYEWNIRRISRRLAECEKRINHETNTDTLITLNRIRSSLEYLIDYYDETNTSCLITYHKHRPNPKKIASSDQHIFTTYAPYYPYFEQMMSSLDSLVINPVQKLPRINTEANHLITVTSDFYSTFKGEISDTFAQIKPTLPTHLQFRRLTGTDVSFAQTLSVYGSKYSYYDIGIVNNAQDYITLFHEMGHGIANFLNPGLLYDYDKYCFIETDTLFWELVGYDYLTDHLSLAKDAFLISLMYLKEYSYDADIICTKHDLQTHFSIPEFKNKKALIDYIKNTIKGDEQYIEDSLYEEIRETYHYGISYLTAIELYLIYRSDPELAIELLTKIIKAKDLNSEGYLKYVQSLGITPGAHIKEYVDILISRGKELGYGKRLYYQH